MGLIRSDQLEIRSPKPTRDTDLVGCSRCKYPSKEDIPMGYRFEFMETTDNSGTKWRLEGGIEDDNWVELKLDAVDQPVYPVTWSQLIELNTNGQVKIWDRFYITDRNNKPLSVEQRDDVGELWYVWTNQKGSQVLHKLPKNTNSVVDLNNLPAILRSRLSR